MLRQLGGNVQVKLMYPGCIGVGDPQVITRFHQSPNLRWHFDRVGVVPAARNEAAVRPQHDVAKHLFPLMGAGRPRDRTALLVDEIPETAPIGLLQIDEHSPPVGDQWPVQVEGNDNWEVVG